MEFFGLTYFGPQNYFADVTKEWYKEPSDPIEVAPLMEKVIENNTCPSSDSRPDVNVIRLIDCYLGRVNGFAYGSFQRFNKMKRKCIIKPVGPADMYRISPTTYLEYGLWRCDPALKDKDWHKTDISCPMISSPNTRVLDFVRKNDKYATLF